jgi:hypothetical protein
MRRPFETGHEDFMTGGWVRVLVSTYHPQHAPLLREQVDKPSDPTARTDDLR